MTDTTERRPIVESTEISRIAIYCLSGFGNILLFTPTLVRLHQMLPKAKIYFLTIRRANYEFVSACPFVESMYLEQSNYNSPLENLRVLRQCLSARVHDFDLSLPVFPSIRPQYNVVGRLLGARESIAFYSNRSSHLMGKLCQSVLIEADAALHDVEQNLQLLNVISGKRDDADVPELTFWSTDSHKSRAAEELARIRGTSGDKAIIGYHPLSFSDMKYKRWPADHFKRLIDLIDSTHECTQILFGGPEEGAELRELAAACNNPPTVISELPLLTVGEIFRSMSLMISNDSGLMHLASAAGVPTVGLFGPTRASRTHPWGANCWAIQTPSKLTPCRGYPFGPDSAECCQGTKCMSELRPEAVYEFIDGKGLFPGGGGF